MRTSIKCEQGSQKHRASFRGAAKLAGDVAERVQLRTSQAHLGASTFPPDEHDPSCNSARAVVFGAGW